jgi:23S rRNA (uracil1939-C5)-methyltransferase
LSIRERIPQVEVAAGDERAALVFRIMQPLSADDAAALERFGARLGVQIHLQPGGLDTIRPLSAGVPPLEYAVDRGAGGRVTLEFGPSDFVQINREVNLAMVAAARPSSPRNPPIPSSTYSAGSGISPCR